jgi:predicted PurR-regulated permease PerM
VAGTLLTGIVVVAVALTVSVPVATVMAVLLGGALAGVTGALVSIPMAAAVLLILREVSIPWLDRS